jgi:hypothetical protein
LGQKKTSLVNTGTNNSAVPGWSYGAGFQTCHFDVKRTSPGSKRVEFGSEKVGFGSKRVERGSLRARRDSPTASFDTLKEANKLF